MMIMELMKINVDDECQACRAFAVSEMPINRRMVTENLALTADQ